MHGKQRSNVDCSPSFNRAKVRAEAIVGDALLVQSEPLNGDGGGGEKKEKRKKERKRERWGNAYMLQKESHKCVENDPETQRFDNDDR